MKRRTKIITSIASITLALAILVFGVYAANTATFTITSSVAFVPNDVFVHCTFSEYYGTAETVVGTPTQIGTTQSWDSYTGTGSAKVPKSVEYYSLESQYGSTNQELGMSYASTIRFVVTIRNDSPFTITISKGESRHDYMENVDLTTSTEKVGESNYSSATGLVANATYTYTRYATVQEGALSAQCQFRPYFAMAKKA
ncbi:MAG: hypothetical protein J6T74_04350 [Clostridia bacterium]|nr:hypothetical protein [Clostridia bacterium]